MLRKFELRLRGVWLAILMVLFALAGIVFQPYNAFAQSGKVVFSANGSIYKMNANGTGVIALATRPTINDIFHSPALSPDGTKVAFVWKVKGTIDKSVIFGVNIDGTYLHQITDLDFWASDPDWSPDNSSIVFVGGFDPTYAGYYNDGCRNVAKSLYTTSFYEGAVGSLPDTSGAYDPAWSPLGGTIAFARNDGIFYLTLSTGVSTRLTTDEMPPADPDWTTLGSKIVYAKGYPTSSIPCNPGTEQSGRKPPAPGVPPSGGLLSVFNLATFTNTLLSNVNASNPVWSPDGSQVLYVSQTETGPSSRTLKVTSLSGIEAEIDNEILGETAVDWR